jgi:hypothetical protein
MLGFRGHLVRSQLSYEVVTPGVMILGVVNDAAALFPVVDHGMENVGAWLALVYPFDLVAFKLAFQNLVEIDFRTFTKLLCRLVIQRPLNLVYFCL